MRRIGIAAIVILGACNSTTTSGGGGVSVMAPATLTHGVCATFTIDYVLPEGDGALGVTTTNQSYHVSAVNGSVFADTACTTPLTGDAVIPAGSNAVDVGFIATAAGPAGINVVSAASSLLTAGAQANAN